MKNQSIKTKIVLIMVIVIFITTAAVVVSRIAELQNRSMESVSDRLENNVNMIDLVFSQMMSYSWAMLDAIYALPQVQDVLRAGSREAANAAMSGLFRANIDVGGFMIYNDFLVFDAQFNMAASANPTSVANARNTPYAQYLYMSERGDKWASDVTISSVTGLAQIWITMPIMEDNTFFGMIAIPVNIQGLPFFLGTQDYETGRYFTVVIDKVGTIAYSNRLEYMGETPVSIGMAASLEELPQRELFEYISTVSGDRDFAFMGIDSGMGWMIISGIDRSYVIATAWEILLGVLPFVLGLIASGLVMFFFVVLTLKPLSILTRALNDIANGEGDLTVRLSETGSQEIAELSRYFNQTLEKIRSLVQNIRMEAKQLADIGRSLATNMSETAAGVNQIVAQIQSIRERILSQSASVSETHSTMDQLVVNIGRLNSRVDNQTNEITQASASIEEMVANIQSVNRTLAANVENVKGMQDAAEIGRSGLAEVSQDIKEIARESESLLGINSVMQNIASQTNLLSMNASIEAAHAGESGKGFAVVADEIRKLAENSSKQSKTISAVLKKIKSSIDKITVSTDNVLNKFGAIDSSVKTVSDQEELIRRAMEEQGQGSQHLLTGVGNVNDITRKVQAGATEMNDGAREVIRESESLEMSTQEIASGMNEMSAGANQINDAVNHVNNISRQNREAIEDLIKEVSRFKVE